jgi:hypothetical protein
MNKPISMCILWILCSVLVLSCSQITSITSKKKVETNPSEMVQTITKVGYNWLDYADPKADANLAIQNNQLQLLAFSDMGSSLPGFGDQQSEQLKRSCGQQTLPSTSDTSTSSNGLEDRKKLYQYAASYNVLVAEACNKIFE